MIHVPLNHADLERLIDDLKPTWSTRAAIQAQGDRAAGKHVSAQTLWSEIKPIFVDHQRSKCGYCERRLGEAAIEWDLEHFRPKRRVDAWNASDACPQPSGSSDANGYYLLAFDPRNYLVACKPCNTNHKRNYFPIAAARELASEDPATLRSELAYLLHPLDPNDADPERLIGFDGVVARPRDATPGRDRDRARTAIQLLQLNRPDLDLARCEVIMHLWNALQLSERSLANRAQLAVQAMTGPGATFANCARCFVDLFRRDRDRADEIGAAATDVVHSHSA